jgi:hypothetical protein
MRFSPASPAFVLELQRQDTRGLENGASHGSYFKLRFHRRWGRLSPAGGSIRDVYDRRSRNNRNHRKYSGELVSHADFALPCRLDDVRSASVQWVVSRTCCRRSDLMSSDAVSWKTLRIEEHRPSLLGNVN